jgi:hypothetical protein
MKVELRTFARVVAVSVPAKLYCKNILMLPTIALRSLHVYGVVDAPKYFFLLHDEHPHLTQ